MTEKRKRKEKYNIQVGDRFSFLTVVEEVEPRNKCRRICCKCDCGKITIVNLNHLVRKKDPVKSCGCYLKKIHTKHGMTGSREYSTWENMIQRCTNPKAKKYSIYGAKGITICKEWKDSFEYFYKDMGPRPPNTSLDRIDSDKGYYKENCRWSKSREQALNLSYFSAPLLHNGVIMPVEDWISKLSLDRPTIKARVIRGLTFKQAMLLNEIDIVVFNTFTREKSIETLNGFLSRTKFDQDKIMELLDNNHTQPFQNYLVRYLVDFTSF